MLDPDAPIAMTELLLTSILFPLAYIGTGLGLLYLRLGDPLNWPLFMKRAASISRDHPHAPNPSCLPDSLPDSLLNPLPTWPKSRVNMRTRTKRSRTAPSPVVHVAGSTELFDRSNAQNGDLVGLGIDMTGGAGSGISAAIQSIATPLPAHHPRHSRPALDPHASDMETTLAHASSEIGASAPTTPMSLLDHLSRTKKKGLFVIALTGFIMLLLWPLFFLYSLVWWLVYSLWAWHYVYLSTRQSSRPRSRNGRQQLLTNSQPRNNVILVTRETNMSTERIDNITDTRPGTTPFNLDGTYSATVESGGDFYRFYDYPQVGKISKKFKAMLEYEAALPTPNWCRAAMLAAERKRRDTLDAGLYQASSTGSSNTNGSSDESLGSTGNDSFTSLIPEIPIRQSSFGHNGRRSSWNPWGRQAPVQDIELGSVSPGTSASRAASIPSPSIPQRRGSMSISRGQRTGSQVVGGSQKLATAFKPSMSRKASSTHGKTRLATIEEGDHAEEEEGQGSSGWELQRLSGPK